jgi:hypothetical protein
MNALAQWFADTRLNRIQKPAAERKFRFLSDFLDLLVNAPANIKSPKAFLAAKSQKRDEVIQVPSMAATIVILVLGLRSGRKAKSTAKPKKGRAKGKIVAFVPTVQLRAVTEEEIAEVTGIKRHVIMACKKAMCGVIALAFADARSRQGNAVDTVCANWLVFT